MLYHFNIECFQKISGPPPWRELEILKGSKLKGLGSSSGVRGLKKNSLPEGTYNNPFLPAFAGLSGAFIDYICCVFTAMLHSAFTTFESRSCIELSRSCKALWALPPRGVWGHGPPGNFEILDSRRCIFQHFEAQNGMFRYLFL